MEISAIAAPTSEPSSRTALVQNFDTFLTLLTTQLRNQDPLNPLDTEKFTEQLVQFSSVEASLKTNTHLETLIALQSSAGRSEALAFVGREATFATDRAALSSAGATWAFETPANAASIEMIVTDASGAVVHTETAAPGAGRREFSWNGVISDGRRAPDGAYALTVKASDASGAPLDSETFSALEVTGAVFENGEAFLETAAGRLPVELVRRVSAADTE